jgi:hypothetical protein
MMSDYAASAMIKWKRRLKSAAGSRLAEISAAKAQVNPI